MTFTRAFIFQIFEPWVEYMCIPSSFLLKILSTSLFYINVKQGLSFCQLRTVMPIKGLGKLKSFHTFLASLLVSSSVFI